MAKNELEINDLVLESKQSKCPALEHNQSMQHSNDIHKLSYQSNGLVSNELQLKKPMKTKNQNQIFNEPMKNEIA